MNCRDSCVAGVLVFGEEELVEEPVHLEKALAVEPHRSVLDPAKTPVVQALQRFGKTPADIHAEFFLEIIAPGPAELELQDKFADEPFVGGGGQGAIQGQAAGLDGADIRLEVVLVLIMGALEMAEGGHAQPDQIGPRPEAVAVKEAGVLIFDSGVGAADEVAGFFQFGETGGQAIG